jgi:arginase
MALSRGEVIILIGGDCTVSIGLVAAARGKVKRLGLIYMDSQTDLNTPATTDTGILDSMGLAHMLGFATNPLSALGGDVPLLDAGCVCVFGFHPQRITSAEHEVLSSEPIRQYPAVQVTGNAAVEASTALAEMEQACDAFVLHFDVDVIDFSAFPAADAPVYRGFGLGFEESLGALAVFAASEKCMAVSVTEFNPDRDKDLELGRRLTSALSIALSGESTKSAYQSAGI